MLQLIRSLENNVRSFMRSLRQAPRHSPRLLFSLSMVDLNGRGNTAREGMVIKGHTRNLSETGLGLIVPPMRNGVDLLAARNRKLLIVLELPSGPVRLQAMPVRYERITRSIVDQGYLLGVRIAAMDKADKLRYLRYLHRLSRGAQVSRRRAINGRY